PQPPRGPPAPSDGSAGHQGRVPALLSNAIVGDADIFACGPTPMLVELVRWAQRADVRLARIQVAHETPMGCGVGTCLGCALPRAGGGYMLTCQDGPCISADLVEWTRAVDACHGWDRPRCRPGPRAAAALGGDGGLAPVRLSL